MATNLGAQGAPTGKRQRRRRGTYAKGLRTSQPQSRNSNKWPMFGTANLQQQEQIATTIGTAVGAACASYTNTLANF